MITNKLLYIVQDINIDNLKKVGVSNFLFPLKGFCVGFNKTYELNEIDDNSFILINRILDNKSLDDLEVLLKNNTKKIKGIVYDDFGVLYLINKLKLDVETINYQTHFATNYKSINETLEKCDSLVVSTDITKNEIDEILSKSMKPLTLFLFGLTPAMYSRRTLLSNFYDEFNMDKKSNANIYEPISNNKFIMVENEYGVVGYAANYYNGLELLDSKNVLYFLVNPLFLNEEQQLQLIMDINNKELTLDINSDNGFLYKETIYKLGDKNEK